MPEVTANRKAWSLLAKDHYEHYRRKLAERHCLLKRIVIEELGDIAGKNVIHLQCNTGADTVSLARLGATVTGVDLVPENIEYARLLAAECGVAGARFFTADLMHPESLPDEQFDVVFTSEGALIWLPDLDVWAGAVRRLLRDDGFFYVFDEHPIELVFDQEKLAAGELVIRYPYFNRKPDREDTIGGYAATPRAAENYCWSYTLGGVVNALIGAGLQVEFLHEYDMLFYNPGGLVEVERGLHRYPGLEGKLPLTFSLKATVRKH